jgi:hypothetical protein
MHCNIKNMLKHIILEILTTDYYITLLPHDQSITELKSNTTTLNVPTPCTTLKPRAGSRKANSQVFH